MSRKHWGMRPYQVEALAKIRTFLEGRPSRELVVMATGTGKTVVKVHALREARALFGPSARTLVLVHRDEIAQQVKAHIQEHVPEVRVGIEKGGVRASRDADVIVASVQSVGRANSLRLEWLNPVLVLVDEAHHSMADTWRRAIDRIGGEAHVLGFTATPYRTGEPLFGTKQAVFESVLYNYDLRTGISEGFLSELRGWLVTTDLDVSQVRIHARDFEGRDLQRVVDSDIRTAIAFKAWRERAADRQTIAFCAGVNHAAHVAEFFRAHGVRATSLTAEVGERERRRILADYEQGAIQVLTNVGILTEGYDSPVTSCVLMLRPTKSWTLYTQMLGRGTRTARGKKDCIVLDVVDVTGKHDVCTLPALAKLPQRTQLSGGTLTEAFDLSDELEGMEAVHNFEGDVASLRVTLAETLALKAKREVRYIEAFGERKTIVEWARDPRCVIDVETLRRRLRNGLAFEEAMTMRSRKIGQLIDAFGEVRTAAEWAEDERCRVRLSGLMRRLGRGMPPEAAITTAAEARDYSGEQFGTVLILKRAGPCRWLGRCVNCGKEKTFALGVIERLRSCGCLRSALITEAARRRSRRGN